MPKHLYAIRLKDWIELREAIEPPVKETTAASKTFNGTRMRFKTVFWHGGRVLKTIKNRRFVERTGLAVTVGTCQCLDAHQAAFVREAFQL